MFTAWLIGIPLVAFLVFSALIAILFYNQLVEARTRMREAWSGIDIQLKRRASLLPNLAETVRGFAAQEHDILTEIAQARGKLMQATGPEAAAAADQTLSQTLGRLMVVAENYPQLKMARSFIQLQEELAHTEEKIAYARQFYNQNVTNYNTEIQSFPGNRFARWFHFEPAVFYTADEAATRDVTVAFPAA